MIWIGWGAILAALAVVGGAFGAHGLAGSLDDRALVLWETANRYLMYGGLGLTAIGAAALHGGDGAWHRAALSLLAGTLVFAGTVGALALGAPRWLGAVTPIGGLLMILGFCLLAWEALRT